VQIGLSQNFPTGFEAPLAGALDSASALRCSGTSGRATSACTFLPWPTALPARAWASTARKWPGPGALRAIPRNKIALASHQKALAGQKSRILQRP